MMRSIRTKDQQPGNETDGSSSCLENNWSGTSNHVMLHLQQKSTLQKKEKKIRRNNLEKNKLFISSGIRQCIITECSRRYEQYYCFFHLSVESFIHSFIYSFIHSFIHSFLQSFILFIQSVTKYMKTKCERFEKTLGVIR